MPHENELGLPPRNQMSPGGTFVDLLGKLVGGVAAGMSDRTGSSAVTASNFIRNLTADQQRAQQQEIDLSQAEYQRQRDIRGDVREDMLAKREDIAYTREQAELDPTSPESQAAQKAARDMVKAVYGRDATPDQLATLSSLPVAKIDGFVTQMGDAAKRIYEEQRDRISDQFRQQQLNISASSAAASAANAAAAREATAAQREGMMDIRRGQLEETRARRQDTERREAAEYFAKTGQTMPGTTDPGEAVPQGIVPEAAPMAPMEPQPLQKTPQPTEPGLPLMSQIKVREAVATEKGKSVDEAQRQLPTVIDRGTEAIKNIEAILAHPGMRSSVGATLQPGFQFVPGTDRASFEAAMQQVRGGAIAQAIEILRGTGQFTQAEGENVAASLNRMDTRSNEVEFRQAAKEAIDTIRKGVLRAKKKAGAPLSAEDFRE